MVNRWWASSLSERYFLETTDRPDIGIDLKAPQATDRGQTNHQSYVLINEIRTGDVDGSGNPVSDLTLTRGYRLLVEFPPVVPIGAGELRFHDLRHTGTAMAA
jgi:hypothetical protein